MQKLNHEAIKALLANKIAQLMHSNFKATVDEQQIYQFFGPTPKLEDGHIALGCFPFAKELKKSPADLAKSLSEHIEQNPIAGIALAKNAGPYLNITIDSSLYFAEVISPINNGKFFERKLIADPEKTMVEYSQPNTHKELHVGHMRNLCLGDALIRLHRYCQFDIIASTFPGDVGTHVAKCLWYFKHFCQPSDIPNDRKGAWLGELYTKAHNLLEDQKGSEKEDQNRTELTQILKQLEQKSGEYYELWKETRQWSIDMMKDVYKWADVEFDIWYFESDVDSESVKLIKKYYDKGLFKEDQGAIGIDLSDDKLGFCLLIKSDGNGLYATKDIELARRKFEDYKIEKSIYVVDKRQAHHFRQVFKTLEKMGYENAKKCYHLQYDFVELPDGAMSSRKGNIVALQSLIDQMQETIKSEHLAKYKDEWNESEIEQTAHQVAMGAIKYGMNKMDPSKKIVFDMKEWLRLDGDSGPYIQYVHARINSMLAKVEVDTTADASKLTHPTETALMVKLTGFNDTVQIACLNYKPSTLCTYLFELSKAFNHFYTECSINKEEDKELKAARAQLALAVKNTIAKGLSLLGIPAPNKM